MARIVQEKKLVNSRILKEYASWVYCDACDKTIVYLCYSNYNNFDLEFKCKCGSEGHVTLKLMTEISQFGTSNAELILLKNRYHCPVHNIPLFSFVEKNLATASCTISCECCAKNYEQKVGY